MEFLRYNKKTDTYDAPNGYIPIWLKTIGKKNEQNFKVLDVLMIQKNHDGSLIIERHQDNKADERYILKKYTEQKIGAVLGKLSEASRMLNNFK